MRTRRGSPDPESLPTVTGYRLLRLIGRGAHGAVFLGYACDDLEKPVAIKYFPPIGKGAYRHELETFRAIESVRRQSGCQHLVEGYAARELPDGAAFIAMAYCAHGTLADLVRTRGSLNDADALRHLCPILGALEVLHKRGLYHKDVKPSNILLASDGTVRLGDFGLVRGLGQSVTQGGTPGFVPPELIRGDRRADGVRIDIYAAGATLYYLLTGFPPLPGHLISFELQRCTASVPLQDAIIRALHVDPARRFATIRDLHTALEEALVGSRCARNDPPPGEEGDRPDRADAVGADAAGADAAGGDAAGADAAGADAAGGEEPPGASPPRSEDRTARLFSPGRLRHLARVLVAVATLLALTAGGVYRDCSREPGTLAAHGTGGTDPAAKSPTPGVRLTARGVVFSTPEGGEVVDPLDEPDSIQVEHLVGVAGGRYLAVFQLSTALVLNRLYLFDTVTMRRASGWERPMVLAVGQDVPEAWGERMDPYDVSSRWFSWRQVRFDDVDGDGELELLGLIGHPRGMASTMILCVDVRTRQIRGAYAQFGTMALLEVTDVDQDGVRDVLFRWQNNYVRLEGQTGNLSTKGAGVLSGRALLSGRRVLGPPSLPGRESDLRYLLLYTALPYARSKGVPLALICQELAWDGIAHELLVLVDSGGTSWSESKKQIRLVPLAEREALHARAYYAFDAVGHLLRTELVSGDTLVLPALPLVADRAPTGALLHPTPGENLGVRIQRVTISEKDWLPAPDPRFPTR